MLLFDKLYNVLTPSESIFALAKTYQGTYAQS